MSDRCVRVCVCVNKLRVSSLYNPAIDLARADRRTFAERGALSCCIVKRHARSCLVMFLTSALAWATMRAPGRLKSAALLAIRSRSATTASTRR